MIAGSRSFAAIGQWAAYVDPDVLAALGAGRRRSSPAGVRPPWSARTPGQFRRERGRRVTEGVA